MNWVELLNMAARAIRLNAIRASLTMIGVIIGVASVITMLAIGTGSELKIAAELNKIGTNNIVVRPGSSTRSGVKAWAGTATRLQLSDATAIRHLPGAIYVAPVVNGTVQARYRGTNWATTIEGVTPEYVMARNWPLASGTFIQTTHIINAANVCVLGQTVARELFGLSNPVGELVIVRQIPCKVIGLLDSKGASSWGRDTDDVILAPITMVQRKIRGRDHLHRIVIQTESRAHANKLADNIRALMRQRHALKTGQDDDFRLHNQADLATASEESARVFNWLLGSIATISLLVGGIGIMNIMLVSVSERTREIGIRRAIGASKNSILYQFIVESITLSSTGGIIGILSGIVASYFLSYFSQLPVVITTHSIVLSFIFAIITGVIFGIYPAQKASKLQPIDALRYE